MFVVSVPSLRLQYSSYLLVVFMCLGGVPQAVQLVLISRAAFIVFTILSCLGILFAFACLIFNLVFREKQ